MCICVTAPEVITNNIVSDAYYIRPQRYDWFYGFYIAAVVSMVNGRDLNMGHPIIVS